MKTIARAAMMVAFLSGPAMAAPPQPIYDWTGPYFGLNIGYSWGKSDTNVSYFNPITNLPIVPPAGSITSATLDLDGLIGGGQIGYNWQTGSFVLGLEADIQWSGQKDTGNFTCAVAGINIPGACLGSTFVPPGVTGAGLTLDQKLSWFGTLRARLGVTVTPTILAYVTGGLAIGHIKTDATLTGITGGGLAVTTTSSSSETNGGWTIGLGVEGVLSGRWTGKLEYIYMDLGDVSGSVTNLPGVIGANYTSSITDNILRIGVNYRF